MRTNNSIKNSITSLICYAISILIGFVTQAMIIKILGTEYLGLNGLFSNILGMLCIFELGIGSAIIYNLYRPISEDNKEEIKSLMQLYKKAYNIIAFLVFFVGILIVPFLKYIVDDVSADINVEYIYILFLLQTVCSYILTYKRSLITAYQKNYIINCIHLGYLIIINILKLLLLFYTKNYYYYLIIMIIGQLLENIIIGFMANKLYPFILEKNINKLDSDIQKNIFTKVKALFVHKIGGIIVLGTDNIIISKFFGVVTVGLYSSYSLIINYVTNFFSQMITSTTASIGNLIVTNKDKNKIFDIFKKIRFLNFWISCFSATSILVIMQPFISFWIGYEYLLSFSVLVVLVFNFFQKLMRNAYSTFKDSAGIWVEDKYIPLVESALNIIFSIICLKLWGLVGVFMGTIISGLALWCYSYPKFVYKKLFDRSYMNYAKETLGYIFLFVIVATITYRISLLVSFSNLLLQIIIDIVICLIIPNLILIIIFAKSDNFKYFTELIKKIIRGVLKK